jgi:hypothetical protein
MLYDKWVPMIIIEIDEHKSHKHRKEQDKKRIDEIIEKVNKPLKLNDYPLCKSVTINTLPTMEMLK